MSENNELGVFTQKGQGKVDEAEKSETPSRARAQHEDEAHELARQVENDTTLQDKDSVREIILAHPRIRVMLVAAAIRNLTAQKFYFDKKAGSMVHEDDSATQMKAVAWLAAYSDGLPVVTNLNMNVNGRGKSALPPDELLANSPAAIDAMKRAVERAEAKAAAAKQKSAAVEVAVT
jgi:hypothetical protein